MIATFGAGCFWSVQYAFNNLTGVSKTSVGYMGGHTPSPTYQQVCSGTTNHVEVVQVEFDEQQVNYEQLLTLFWQLHDPTTLNRQGPDIGSQYRSVVFYHAPTQQQAAQQMLIQLTDSSHFAQPIVTSIEPAADYWLAEDYHQHYVAKRRGEH